MGTSVSTRTTINPAGNNGEIQWNDNGSFGADSNLFWDNTNKYLGVGNNSPQAILDVRAQGVLSTDIAFRVRNSADTFNSLVVNGAGDVFNNGGGGVSGNVAFGEGALLGNTTGNNNTAIGGLTLASITTTGGNTAIGRLSLFSATGTNNTSVGSSAFQNLTTGNNNVAFGQNSGRYIADGVTNNTLCSLSVFIGQNTKALANNQTNQIVIGHDGRGLGSNTAVIGNTNTTLFRPHGNVAIGSDTAGARLDVRAQGVLSTDIAFRVRNSANTENILAVNGEGLTTLRRSSTDGTALQIINTLNEQAFRFDTNGILNIGNNSQRGSVYSGSALTNAGQPTTTDQSNIVISNSRVGSVSLPFGSLFVTREFEETSTANSETNLLLVGHRSGLGFNPTSGSARFTASKITPNINQTGGANGVTRGLFIAPTIIASADWRAIETSIGGAYFNTTNVQSSAILQADSTTKGFLPPRMTTVQRDAIVTPVAGLVVYNTTDNKHQGFDGSTWNNFY